MNWKNVLIVGAVTLLPVSMMAQANILNAKRPEEIGVKTEAQKAADNDAPLEYGYVDDRDILWSKTVWEVIDLDERVILEPIEGHFTMFLSRTSKMVS